MIWFLGAIVYIVMAVISYEIEPHFHDYNLSMHYNKEGRRIDFALLWPIYAVGAIGVAATFLMVSPIFLMMWIIKGTHKLTFGKLRRNQ